jgi:hypothetical protein
MDFFVVSIVFVVCQAEHSYLRLFSIEIRPCRIIIFSSQISQQQPFATAAEFCCFAIIFFPNENFKVSERPFSMCVRCYRRYIEQMLTAHHA